jgi:uncharacterized membrane protein
VTPPPRRKLWLDWQRGLAVLFMVEVHVLDAWLADGAGAAGGWWFHTLRMMGGLAAPGFLYMAGISQALAEAAQAGKGIPPAQRRRAALGRALWLLKVAYGFRIAEFLFGYARALANGWWDSVAYGLGEILKVDILNVIAVGLAVSALLTVGIPRKAGAVLAAAAAALAVLVTPLAATWPRPGSPVLARMFDYVYGSWPHAQFHLLNWVGFLLAGAAVVPLAAGEGRLLRGLVPRSVAVLALGAGLYALGAWADRLPDVYAHQDFWRTSPSWFAMRLGICVGITGALQLVPDAAERGLRGLSLLGRQSLAGYIASVELTYGALATPFRKALSFRSTVFGIVAMIGVTWAISIGWERVQAWRKGRARPTPAAA